MTLSCDASLIAARTIAEIKDGFEHEVVEREAERLRNWLEDRSNLFFAALEGDRPVGFALGYLLDRIDGTAPMLFFYEIEVLPEHRRQGVGTSLVEAMKSIARAERVAKMWVQTDPKNAVPARATSKWAGREASCPRRSTPGHTRPSAHPSALEPPHLIKRLAERPKPPRWSLHRVVLAVCSMMMPHVPRML